MSEDFNFVSGWFRDVLLIQYFKNMLSGQMKLTSRTMGYTIKKITIIGVGQIRYGPQKRTIRSAFNLIVGMQSYIIEF